MQNFIAVERDTSDNDNLISYIEYVHPINLRHCRVIVVKEYLEDTIQKKEPRVEERLAMGRLFIYTYNNGYKLIENKYRRESVEFIFNRSFTEIIAMDKIPIAKAMWKEPKLIRTKKIMETLGPVEVTDCGSIRRDDHMPDPVGCEYVHSMKDIYDAYEEAHCYEW